MSRFNTFELSNISMKKGKSIAAFSNHYLGLLPANFDPNNDHTVDILCHNHQRFGSNAWCCLGNKCPLENLKGFLSK